MPKPQAIIRSFEEDRPRISPSAFIAPGAAIIGQVDIADDSSIWYGCILRGDVNDIRIGARVNIQDGTVIHVSTRGQGTYIGDDVSVGHMALLHACTVEARAFIGMKAVLMDDSFVESGAMVAAGALITPGKRVKAGQLWAGWPAKYMRDLRKQDEDLIHWTASHYVKLAQRHMKTSIDVGLNNNPD